jgi:HEAT repeat protein
LAIGLILLSLLVTAGAPARAGLPKCTCTKGNGCYHFLNAPVSPPWDPCSCPLCRAARGSCPRKLQPGWDLGCANSGRLRCFLRRHAASWKISCSDCLSGECDCKNPHPEWCPSCGEKGHDWHGEGLKRIEHQVEVERRLLGLRKKLVVLTSPHFYLVSDLRSLKVKTQGGTPRVMSMHEIGHVFIQRAEMAYQEFMRYFGPAGKVHLPRPSAIYLLEKERVKQDVAREYFGLMESELFYGGDIDRIGGGYPYNGCAISLQKYDDDDWMHFQMRHLVAHLLVSCWIQVTGKNDHLPRWMYAGTGHWLSRLPKRFREMANFCAGEGNEVQHSGRRWKQKILAFATGTRSHPIQKIFDVNSLGGLDLQMHIRAWSWFDVWLEEDRERFVKFLAGLREGKDQRIALREAMGISPEEFERRWRDRVTGRRFSVAPTPAEIDAADPEAVGARERDAIRSETDHAILAAKIRALQAVDDPVTAATIVPLLATDSEAVRETIVLVLSRTKSAEVREWLRTTGLERFSGIVRAHVARVLGNLRDEESGAALAEHANDSLWLTRAHVARALGLTGHEPGIPLLEKRLRDGVLKVRIAAMDALARFGKKAALAWEAVSRELGTGAWQVRSTAAGCLGELGEWKAVEPLISRMEIESGRIRKDIRDALKKITRDDLGNNPKHWRDWWDKEKDRHGGKPPPGAPPEKEAPKGRHEYATPTYYGLRVFSQGLGYVLDTSKSMIIEIKLDPAWLKKHRRDYLPEGKKFHLAKREIEASLRALDPRVRFNLYFFRTGASVWKNNLLPASPSNVNSAVNRITAEEPRPPRRSRPGERIAPTAHLYQTNYVDVFRLVFGVKRGTNPATLADTPDTIYFLTDGKPTAGDIRDPDTLLSWFAERNQFARLKVNVITFGHQESNPEFLRGLAEGNGGAFVEIPAVK